VAVLLASSPQVSFSLIFDFPGDIILLNLEIIFEVDPSTGPPLLFVLPRFQSFSFFLPVPTS